MHISCPQCGFMSIRIRRSWPERLRYPGQAKYECLGCTAVFIIDRERGSGRVLRSRDVEAPSPVRAPGFKDEHEPGSGCPDSK